MADTFERIIYKLEIDDSSYSQGVEKLSASTSRLSQVQEAANKALKILQEALNQQSKTFQQAKLDLDKYTGSDEKLRQQLTKTFNDEKANNDNLIKLVAQARKEYEAATKAAQDFANTSARANNLQSQPGARIAPQPTQAAGISSQIFNTIDLTDMAELAEITAQTKTEFDELADSIQLAEERLKQLDPASEEFKQLAPIVEQGNKALKEYGNATKEAEGSQASLRTQLRNARDELTKMEIAGKGATKEYIELEKRTAKLSDAFQDQQQRIKILASDTKLLDFGKGAITAATSAFQAYTAVSILAGDESEELQKKTMQLFAAMQLLQSLEQLSNLTRREGVLATLAQSAAQSAYTAVVGASTGALRVFKLALAATGIGAVIAGIAFLVIKYNELAEASKEAAAEQKALTEIGQEAAKGFAAEVTHLTLIKDKLNDLTIPQKERVKLAKEFNKTAEEGNKIDLKQIDNIKLINAAIDTQIAKIKERGLARAAETVIAEKAEAVFRLQAAIDAANITTDPDAPARTQRLRDEQKALDDRANALIAARAKILGIKPIYTNELLALSGLSDDQINAGAKNSDKLKFLQDANLKQQLRSIDQQRSSIAIANKTLSPALRKLFDDLGTAEQELRAASRFGAKFITTDSLIPPPGSSGAKEIENEFAKRLRELQLRLAQATAKSFESEGTIREQFRLSLEKEVAEINKLTKAQATDEQKAILIDLLVKINDVQLKEALGAFNKKVTDARNKLNEELRDLQNKNTEETIQLLQDEFERRKQLIDFNEKQELAQSEQNTAERLAALESQRDLVGEQAYQDAKNIIVQEGEDEQTNIIVDASRQRQQLSADIFKKALGNISEVFEEQILQLDETTAEKVKAEKALFDQGVINYDEFQKRITKILKDQKTERDKLRLQELNSELKAINDRLKTVTDPKEKEDLQKRRRDVRGQIADLEIQINQNTEDPNKKRKESLQDYANSIGELTDSIIQFWQAANQAEADALDRSISLQEKRVDAAQRIAERGNAQYLKAEEDRLKELQVARENAARRQLAIDAALQGSQLLVGITGAIAKIATPGIGIAETIGAIAVIVGALATGYGLVKSLQGNQPTFFKGTKYLKRDGHPSGRDTIPVMANEGEAIIPTDKNKAYHPTISAIYDGKIPPETINNFVKNYSIKPVPLPNYQRIKEAAEISVGHDGKMAVLLSEHSNLLKENNDLQREILRKKIHVENKIDRNGVSSMVYEYLEQQRISKNT